MDRQPENDYKLQENINHNFTDNFKFTTRLEIKDDKIEVIESAKLLGNIISNDLKWDLNTSSIVKKANASC